MTGWGLAVGIMIGAAAMVAAGLEWLIGIERYALQLPPTSRRVMQIRPMIVATAIALFGLLLYQCEVRWLCLDTPEVQPSATGFHARVAYHIVLVGLLVLATTIDFDCYLIPDVITLPGMLIGMVAAVVIQELQIAHLWVDWAYAVPQLRGPYIPDWYDRVRWAHALAWSGTGLIVGMALTQGVRLVSSRLLQMEAMGFGDVTLMGMIGSFLGWQAVVLTFLIAPLVGLIAVVIVKLSGNPRILPYGPFLSAAAVIVLLSWSRLWAATRMMFSDLVGLGMLFGIGLAVLVILLGAIRLYRAIPTGREADPPVE